MRGNRNGALRERIIALAHRHRRYSAGMIYPKLRQDGLIVNHKRVDRLYALAKLQVRRRISARRARMLCITKRPSLVRSYGTSHIDTNGPFRKRMLSARLP